MIWTTFATLLSVLLADDNDAPTVRVIAVGRGMGPTHHPTLKVELPRHGTIEIAISPGLGDSVRYVAHYIDGRLPDNLQMPTPPLLADSAGTVVIQWDDGGNWEQDPFLFRLFVEAVTRDGTPSGSSNAVVVGHDGTLDSIRQDAEFKWLREHYPVPKPTFPVLPSAAAIDSSLARADMMARARIDMFMTSDVFEALARARKGRVDRVKSDFSINKSKDSVPFEDTRFVLVETGRTITVDELFQLRSILTDRNSYLRDVYTCSFSANYAFSLSDGERHMYAFLGTDCHQIILQLDGVSTGSDLTGEAGQLIRTFCASLFEMEPLTSR